MPVFSKGSRFHDASVPSHRAWTVQRRVGEGQSAEVYSVRCEQEPSTQVGRHTLKRPVHTFQNITAGILAVCCQDRARARNQNLKGRIEGTECMTLQQLAAVRTECMCHVCSGNCTARDHFGIKLRTMLHARGTAADFEATAKQSSCLPAH